MYAVEFSHRSGRDLVNMAKQRPNVVPIIEDARHPQVCGSGWVGGHFVKFATGAGMHRHLLGRFAWASMRRTQQGAAGWVVTRAERSDLRIIEDSCILVGDVCMEGLPVWGVQFI